MWLARHAIPDFGLGGGTLAACPRTSNGAVDAPGSMTHGLRAYDRLDSAFDRRAYAAIRQAVVRHLPSLPLSTSPETMNSLMRAVLDDSPQLFWFEGQWTMAKREGVRVALLRYGCDYVSSRLRLEELKRDVGAVADQMDERDPHVALRLYDWMVRHVSYGASESSGQTSYDALVRREALCKGIAKGYQLLLARMGVPSALVRGTIRGAGRHVWNLVRVRGSLLHVDVTLAHGRFDHLFSENERDDPRRCFLMSEEVVRGHGITIEEG